MEQSLPTFTLNEIRSIPKDPYTGNMVRDSMTKVSEGFLYVDVNDRFGFSFHLKNRLKSRIDYLVTYKKLDLINETHPRRSRCNLQPMNFISTLRLRIETN